MVLVQAVAIPLPTSRTTRTTVRILAIVAVVEAVAVAQVLRYLVRLCLLFQGRPSLSLLVNTGLAALVVHQATAVRTGRQVLLLPSLARSAQLLLQVAKEGTEATAMAHPQALLVVAVRAALSAEAQGLTALSAALVEMAELRRTAQAVLVGAGQLATALRTLALQARTALATALAEAGRAVSTSTHRLIAAVLAVTARMAIST